MLACNRENNSKQILPADNPIQISAAQINVNTASAAELETLPHVGEKTARDIIEYRERFGAFRKPEHLLLVRRINNRRFQEIKNLIRVE